MRPFGLLSGVWADSSGKIVDILQGTNKKHHKVIEIERERKKTNHKRPTRRSNRHQGTKTK